MDELETPPPLSALMGSSKKSGGDLFVIFKQTLRKGDMMKPAAVIITQAGLQRHTDAAWSL